MIVITSLEELEQINKSVVTIGKFDGLHKGHKVLIEKTVQYAKKNNMKSVVFTFSNHPANFFESEKVRKIITNKDKINTMKDLGVDIVINLPFDEFMTKISAIDFVEKILVKKLNAKKIYVGHDFTFARNKEGDAILLKALGGEYDFDVDIVKPIKINNIRVSSTYIRNLLAQGKVESVKEYLGSNYIVEGIVIEGKQIGRTMGFPTANLKFKENLILPRIGIYATKVYIGDKVYIGATNIGFNPTVRVEKLSIETHILQFNEDIYGKNIKIEFLERIRDEKKFNSLDELKKSSFGILEPSNQSKIINKENIDLLIVPMVAFDSNHNRLGYGGGYYDRYLKNYAGKVIGLAFSFQQTEALPVESFDIPIKTIIDEK